MSKHIKIGSCLSDIKKFATVAQKREKDIEQSRATFQFTDYISENAKALHPEMLSLVVTDLKTMDNVHSREYTLSSLNKNPLPFFRAGQYISLKMTAGDSAFSRPYSICSSPGEALQGFYKICIQDFPGSFAAHWILQNWKIGTQVIATPPSGDFYYQSARDCRTVAAIAGGSGITPFVSMAKAIAEGSEDFNLVIFRCSKNRKDIFYADELERISYRDNRIKIVDVLENDFVAGGETGFITARAIVKHIDSPEFSVFACGPSGLYDTVLRETSVLGIPKRLVRLCPRAIEHPVFSGAVFKLTVLYGNETFTVDARMDETILESAERGGITIPSNCRSGKCGFCKSRLLKGKITVHDNIDSRRYTDKQTGFIHPCCSFPLSDCTVEIPIV